MNQMITLILNLRLTASVKMSLCRAQDVFMAPNINSIVLSNFKPFYTPKLTGSFLSDHDRYSSGRMRDKNLLGEENNNYKEENKQKQCLSPSFEVHVLQVFILRVHFLQVHVLQVGALHGRVLQVQSVCY